MRRLLLSILILLLAASSDAGQVIKRRSAAEDGGGGTISFVDYTANGYDFSDDKAIAVPAGVQNGDLMIAAVILDELTTPGLPGGWTQVALVDQSTNHRMQISYRIYQTGDAASFTWTWTGSKDSRSGITAYRSTTGFAADPFDCAESIDSDNGTTADFGSITTVTATTMGIGIVYHSNNAAAATGAYWTFRYNPSDENLVFADHALSSSGATGAQTMTITASNWLTIFMAIKAQ